MKRTLLILIGIVLLSGILFGVGFGAFFWRFQAHPPKASYPPPENEIQARLQDLDYLLNLPETDHSFSDEETVRFEQHVRSLQESVETMSDAEFVMGVAAAAAISENGHTNLITRDLFKNLNSLPVRFFWFGDGLHIVRARDTHEALLGARVVLYEGKTPEALVSGLDPFFGGNAPFLQFNVPSFLASPAAMHAAGLAGQPDQATLTLIFADGRQREVVIEPEENPTAMMSVDEASLPIPSRQEKESGHDWRFAPIDTIAGAHYARQPETYHWTDNLPGEGFYVRLRLILDQDEKSLSRWLADLGERLRAQPVDYLVIDVRSTFGGNYLLARKFALSVSDFVAPGRRIYLLTDGGTFSAAIVTQAFALHAAGAQGVVVGSTIGDDEQFWAEGGGFLTLPNSGLRIWVATGYHDWENGCTDWAQCFWLNIALGVAAGPLDPDINAPLTYADYTNGVDTTLQAVFAAEGITSP